MVYVGCCVFGDVMSPVVSLASVGLKAVRGRLRLLVCVVCVWWLRESENFLWCAECAEGLGAFRKRWVSIDLQYSLENLGECQTSLFFFFFFNVLVGRDVCASCFPRRGEGGVEAVLVEHV